MSNDEEERAEARRRAWEVHQKARDVLFSNETFFIGMLQAVSGASLFAALAQSDAIAQVGGRYLPLTFLTLMAAALVSAVLAAYWKYEYKKWDVKQGAAADPAQASERNAKAKRFLNAMRAAMLVAVSAIVAAVVGLVAAGWLRATCA
jgi:hypothetical protein